MLFTLGEVVVPRRGATVNTRDVLRQRGAITTVSIGYPKSLADGLRARGKPVPPPRTISAMIDTGASISAIEDSVAKSIGLVKTGATYITGVGGASQRPIYSAQIFVSPPSGIRYDPIQIAGVTFGSPQFSMLIGRDILSDLALSYMGKQGKFSITV